MRFCLLGLRPAIDHGGVTHLRRSILACGLVLGLAGISTAAAAATGSNFGRASHGRSSARAKGHTAARSRTRMRMLRYWHRRIRTSRSGTRHWLQVMRGRPPQGHPRSLQSHPRRPLRSVSVGRLQELARQWRRREHTVWLKASHPPDLAAWLCIHRYEGSWADSGAPYWGGLQMNLSFQATYGGWLLRHKGTADHWSPLEQIWTAVRAWRVRGFSPWASTARACGNF